METWKSVKDYEDFLLVSNYGRIKRLPTVISKCKRGERYTYGSLTNGYMNTKGYCVVSITVLGNKKLLKVHRLVAEAFIPKVDGKNDINHINGVKNDNRVENLEWCNCAENIHHAFRTGLSNNGSGVTSHHAKLTTYEVNMIRWMRKEFGTTHKELANSFNCTRANIGCIINNKSWRVQNEL